MDRLNVCRRRRSRKERSVLFVFEINDLIGIVQIAYDFAFVQQKIQVGAEQGRSRQRKRSVGHPDRPGFCDSENAFRHTRVNDVGIMSGFENRVGDGDRIIGQRSEYL